MYICKIIQLILCIDVHSIAIIRAEESYEHLAEGFGDVFSEINGIIESPEVTIYGEIYTVIFYLCCDYKVCNKL